MGSENDADARARRLMDMVDSLELFQKNALDNKKRKHSFLRYEPYALLLVFLSDLFSGVLLGFVFHLLFFGGRFGLSLACFLTFGACAGLYSFFRGQHRKARGKN